MVVTSVSAKPGPQVQQQRFVLECLSVGSIAERFLGWIVGHN
jgi:hypothetical protein